jgi:DNA polymerase-3 subunit chi
MGERCQVDFYLLGSPDLEPERLACRLALMAWERGHEVSILTDDAAAAAQVDELLWHYPEGRFVPHETGEDSKAPVRILHQAPAGPADVLINLTKNPLDAPLHFQRLLEIVPHRKAERTASRDKFRHYRAAGLDPQAHDIN